MNESNNKRVLSDEEEKEENNDSDMFVVNDHDYCKPYNDQYYAQKISVREGFILKYELYKMALCKAFCY